MMFPVRLQKIILISTLLMLIAFFFTGTLSCSGGHNALVPSISNDQVNPLDSRDADFERGHNVLGFCSVYLDTETWEITIEVHRTAEVHVNLSAFLTNPNCPGGKCLRWQVVGYDPISYIYTVDLNLTNPTAIAAYDVRVILSELPHNPDTGAKWEVKNPDSFTHIWDNDPVWSQEAQWINPFIAFEKEDKTRMFLPDPDGSGVQTYADTEKLLLLVPPKSGTAGEIKVILDACWPDHCKDPYEISRMQQSDDLPPVNQTSSVYFECIVADWQEDISDVSLYMPDIIDEADDGYLQMHEWPTTGVNAWPPGDGQPPFDQEEIDFMSEFGNYDRDTLRKYWCNVTNDQAVHAGTYDAIVVAKSIDTDGDDNDTLYNRFNFKVQEGGSGGDPNSHLQVVYSSYKNEADADIYSHCFLAGDSEIRLTNDGGRHSDELEVCINAAATTIVFISNYNKNSNTISDFELYKMPITYLGNVPVSANSDNTGAWVQLTQNNWDDRMPDFAPNGSMIAFSADRYGGQYEIFTLNLGGGTPFRVTQSYGNDESPNYDRSNAAGQWLYFQSDRAGGGNYEIYGINPTVVESSSNLPTRYTFNTSFDGYPATRGLGGAVLAWTSDRFGDMDILLTDFINETQNLTPETDAMDIYPSFSKDGHWIAFTSDRKDGNQDIWRMYSDGSNATRITNFELPDIDPCYGGG
jgi:hypothetical protein